MNKPGFYFRKLFGQSTVCDCDLLGQQVTLGISAARELNRARDIAN